MCAISTSRPVGANPQVYACGREPSRVPIRKGKAPLRVFVTLSHVVSYCMSVSSLALIVLRAETGYAVLLEDALTTPAVRSSEIGPLPVWATGAMVGLAT